MIHAVHNAMDDIRSGLRLRNVWIALALEDIVDQHRRTTLGPIWLLVNYLAFAGVFVFIFKRGSGIDNYAAYVSTGLLVWFYIMEVINGSASLFVREENFIKGTTLPLSVYILRETLQSLIRTTYALLGCMVILALTGNGISYPWIWSAAGIALIISVTPAVVTIFAFLGAYFPDSQFLISNIMRIAMFLTPVFWAPASGDTLRQLLYEWNPFTHFLEIVRYPIITGQLPANAILICLAIGAVFWLMALLVLGSFRRKIVFFL